MSSLIKGNAVLKITTVIAIVFAMVLAASASAYGAQDSPRIRLVDTTGMIQGASGQGTVVVAAPVGKSSDDIKIKENGKTVDINQNETLAASSFQVATAYVVDGTWRFNGPALKAAKDAISADVTTSAANQHFAVLDTAKSRPVLAALSNNSEGINNVVGALSNEDQTAFSRLWEVGGLGLDETGKLVGAIRQVVLVVGAEGGDELSVPASYDELKASALKSGTTVSIVSYGDVKATQKNQYEQLAQVSGGNYLNAKTESEISNSIEQLADQRKDQRVFKYASKISTTWESPKNVNITAELNGTTTKASVATGAIFTGDSLMVDSQVSNSGPLPPFVAKILPLLAMTGLVVLLALVIYGIAMAQSNSVRTALRPYSDDPAEKTDFSKLADSALIKRAVEATNKAADERGILDAVSAKLEQADLPLNPGETILGTMILAVIGAVIGYFALGILGSLIFVAFFAIVPLLIVNFLGARRKRKFNSQLPDILQLLAGSLRAGYSFMQGIDAVAKQAQSPMKDELTRALSEARLGRPVEEALDDVAVRMGSDDFSWAVMAVKIQREVGGNLAELLMTVAETMVARERLRREIAALTAEGRLSAIILCALPFGVGGIIMVMNPSYIMPFLEKLIGQVVIGTAILMIIAGYIIMQKMIKVEA